MIKINNQSGTSVVEALVSISILVSITTLISYILIISLVYFSVEDFMEEALQCSLYQKQEFCYQTQLKEKINTAFSKSFIEDSKLKCHSGRCVAEVTFTWNHPNLKTIKRSITKDHIKKALPLSYF